MYECAAYIPDMSSQNDPKRARHRQRQGAAFPPPPRRSKYDRNSDNYPLPVALADLSAVLIALGIAPAVLIGSFYGGLLTMMLPVMRPTAIAGAILNDIGSVIEPRGLVRNQGLLGKLPVARNFEQGAEILRWLFEGHFPKLTPQDWIVCPARLARVRR